MAAGDMLPACRQLETCYHRVGNGEAAPRRRRRVRIFALLGATALGWCLLTTAEQAVDTSRFQRIRELYQDITLENTLKLLIRCKISFDNRKRLLAVFLCHGEWERQCNKLLKLLEQSGGAGKELSEEDKQNIAEQFAKMKKKAESLLKRLIDYTKNENKGNLVGAAPENEPDQQDEGQPEPIRALKFRGKGMGSTISETVQELSQRTQEALGSKHSVQADLKVKFSEFQSRRTARETTKYRPSPRQLLLLEVMNDRGESHFHRTRHRGGRALPVPGSPEGRFISRVRFEV